MDSAKELSIEFLRSHSEAATAVLESIGPADAAAFLKYVPDNIAVTAFGSMQPTMAAAVMSALTLEKASAVLPLLDVHSRSSILRILGEDKVRSIMAQMPKSIARDMTRSLHYPAGSAGAWMSLDVGVFEKSTTVRECIASLRALSDRVINLIFVVDARKMLVGSVDLGSVLAASDDTLIGAVANTGIKRLSPFSQLASIVGLAAWDAALSLPVVDHRGRFLGALHFDRLREGLSLERKSRTEGHLGQIVVHLAEAFLVCAAGMVGPQSRNFGFSRPIAETED